jgi:GWxTD domain-containing protein
MKKLIINSFSFILIIFLANTYAQKSYENGSSFYQQGKIALKENNLREAEVLFKHSAYEFSYAPSYFALAEFEYRDNTIQSRTRARKYLQKAIWKEPQNIEYRLFMAELMKYFSSDMAYDVYEEILEINPACVEALFEMGKIKEDEFYEFHKSVRQEELSPALSLNSYAYKDFMTAERFFKKAIKYDPENIEYYLHLSYLYEEIGQMEKGISLLRKVIEIDPQNKNAYLFLGLLCYKTANYDSCQILYKKAMEIMKEDEKEDFKINSAMLLLGDLEEDQKQAGNMLNEFWSMNDPLYLTEYNERILAHYSRVAYSNLKFSVEDQDLIGWQSDRGEIMIRFGEPINRIRFRPYINAGGRTALMLKTDVWLYQGKVFGFTDNYWTNNYRFSAPNYTGRHFSQYKYDTHTYTEYLRRTNPEDYIPEFKGPVFNVPFNTVQFKDLDDDENNSTNLYLNYALDVSDKFEFNDRYKYQHQYGLFLLDNKAGKLKQDVQEVTYLNSNREIISNKYEKFWVGSIMIEAQPDSGMLAFEIIREEDKGVSTNHFGFNIKSFSKSDFCISDILLAADVRKPSSLEGAIIRRNLELLPNPTHSFTAGNNIFIYYEAYNLEQNYESKTRFEQSITIKKIKESSVVDDIFSSISGLFGSDSKKDQITLTTDYQSFEKNTQVYMQIDMSAYDPGDYVVTVTVEDKLAGKESSAETIMRWR